MQAVERRRKVGRVRGAIWGPTANATPTMSMPSRKKIRGLTAGSRSCREEGNPPVCPASVHQSRFVLSPKEARTALRLTRTPAGVSMIDPPCFSSRRGCEQIFESPLNSWPLYTILTIGENPARLYQPNRGIPVRALRHIHPDTSMAVDIPCFYHLPGVRRARLFQVGRRGKR